MSTYPWTLVPLGDGMVADEPLNQIEAQFAERFGDGEAIRDAAIFVKHELTTGLHCQATAYFSPAAGVIGEAWQARPCSRPAAGSLRLVCGHPSCWSLLFSGAQVPE